MSMSQKYSYMTYYFMALLSHYMTPQTARCQAGVTFLQKSRKGGNYTPPYIAFVKCLFFFFFLIFIIKMVCFE